MTECEVYAGELRRQLATLRAEVRRLDIMVATKLADIAVIEDLLAADRPNHVPGGIHE